MSPVVIREVAVPLRSGPTASAAHDHGELTQVNGLPGCGQVRQVRLAVMAQNGVWAGKPSGGSVGQGGGTLFGADDLGGGPVRPVRHVRDVHAEAARLSLPCGQRQDTHAARHGHRHPRFPADGQGPPGEPPGAGPRSCSTYDRSVRMSTRRDAWGPAKEADMPKHGANGPKSRARNRQKRDGVKYTEAAAAGPDRLAVGLAARSDGALTVEQATRRLGLGGQEYRRFLERGRQGVAEALRAALGLPELHPSRPHALRDALPALDRHAVGPEAQMWLACTGRGDTLKLSPVSGEPRSVLRKLRTFRRRWTRSCTRPSRCTSTCGRPATTRKTGIQFPVCRTETETTTRTRARCRKLLADQRSGEWFDRTTPRPVTELPLAAAGAHMHWAGPHRVRAGQHRGGSVRRRGGG